MAWAAASGGVPTLLPLPHRPLLPGLPQNKDLALPQHSDRAHKLLADNDTTVHMSYDVRCLVDAQEAQASVRACRTGCCSMQALAGGQPALPSTPVCTCSGPQPALSHIPTPVAGVLRRTEEEAAAVAAKWYCSAAGQHRGLCRIGRQVAAPATAGHDHAPDRQIARKRHLTDRTRCSDNDAQQSLFLPTLPTQFSSCIRYPVQAYAIRCSSAPVESKFKQAAHCSQGDD